MSLVAVLAKEFITDQIELFCKYCNNYSPSLQNPRYFCKACKAHKFADYLNEKLNERSDKE